MPDATAAAYLRIFSLMLFCAHCNTAECELYSVVATLVMKFHIIDKRALSSDLMLNPARQTAEPRCISLASDSRL